MSAVRMQREMFKAAVLSMLCVMAAVCASPSTPNDGPPTRSATDQLIRFYQSKLAADPDDYVNYNRLSSAYVQKARETGDISYYQLVAKGLRKSLELESHDAEAASSFTLPGSVQFAEHRFAEAASSADR